MLSRINLKHLQRRATRYVPWQLGNREYRFTSVNFCRGLCVAEMAFQLSPCRYTCIGLVRSCASKDICHTGSQGAEKRCDFQTGFAVLFRRVTMEPLRSRMTTRFAMSSEMMSVTAFDVDVCAISSVNCHRCRVQLILSRSERPFE